jgi:hypothetical protein
MPLRPQLQSIRLRADATRAKAEVLRRLTDGQLLWAPSRDRWPIAMILDHLNKVHELILPKFEDALRNAPPAGADRNKPVRYRFSDRILLRMMGPNSPVKVPVPQIFEPELKANPARTVVSAFFANHDSLASLIDKSDGRDVAKIRVSSPAMDRLKAGYLAYLDGTIAHETYHWGQIEALLKDPNFPAA